MELHIRKQIEEFSPNKKPRAGNLLWAYLNLEKGTVRNLESSELKTRGERGITRTIDLYHLADELEEDHISFHVP